MAKFDKVIPPGQEGKIDIAVDGSRVHGHGSFVKNTTVKTNDPSKRQFTLSIAASEVPYLNVEPAGTVFLQGQYGEPASHEFLVTSNEKDLDFKVTGLTSNIDDKITYTSKPSGKPGEYVLDVYKNPKLPTLTTYGSLFIHTNSKRSAQSEVQIGIITKGSITVSPMVLNFGRVPFGDNVGAGNPVTKSVVLSAQDAFQVTGVDLNNANFAASTEPMGDGSQYRVLVTFRPPMKQDEQQSETAEMIIHTGNASEPAIRVQVVARAM